MLRDLATIEGARAAVDILPLPLAVEKRLRREARVRVAHNSTWIENRTLSLDEARRVIEDKAELDATRGSGAAARELRNYWAALDFIENAAKRPLTEDLLRQLHAIIYRGARGPGRPAEATPYRTTHVQVGRMEYLPPEPGDVPRLMAGLVDWLNGPATDLPGPIVAAIAAYQFVTIHPFTDGNGRTCRALATLLLKRAGYGLKGLASMESFYAADVQSYYAALQMGLHHNYYESNVKGSRSDPDLTPWLAYFLAMFARAAKELRTTVENQTRPDSAGGLDELPRQVRQVLGEVPGLDAIFTPSDVAAWFGVSTKTAREWLSAWRKQGHVEAVSGIKRVRSYRISHALAARLRKAGVA